MTGGLHRTVEMPWRIAKLDRDKHGRPVPWFVHRDASGPDFRVIRRDGIQDALHFNWCWVCGQPRGRWASFVIGPMCAVNRVSPEPPSHRECAEYSARACPFLTTPAMRRRTSNLPEDHGEAAGISIKRNPGVALVWSSKTWKVKPAPGGPGYLFDVGDPTSVQWLCEGREATHAEVMHSIDTGMPLLEEVATEDGPAALAHLQALRVAALRLVPAP